MPGCIILPAQQSRQRRGPFLELILSGVLAAAVAAGALVRADAAPSDDFFNDPVIRTFQIQVEDAGLALLRKDDRGYVRATVTEGTNVFKEVGIHLKGMGSFRPFNEKPSIAVKFDRHQTRQRYRGLTKIMLNNASQDGTYLAELIATQMFRDAGVPAARVTHAFVQVNGRSLGLYVVIEAMNKEFLRQHFSSARGNLYEAYLQDIDQRLDQDGGVDDSQADLKKLLAVCRLPDRLERWQRLPEVLDVDGYLSHLSIEMFTAHTDGYALNRNNYRLYHDPASARFVFLAHGIDWAFQSGGESIRRPLNSIVTHAILEIPEGRRRYRERMSQLFTNVFRVDVLTNRVNAAVDRLVAAARQTNEAREFAGFGTEMRNRIVVRHKSVAEQLAVPEPTPLKFAADGTARLTGWTPRKVLGDGILDQPAIEDRATLHLRVNKGETILSWRTRVLLDEGRYRLEGRVRTSEVVALTNKVELSNGAGLRVSLAKRTSTLVGDNAWVDQHFDFEALAGDEKELICELRASQGEVWFDVGSLRLVRRR